MPSFKDLNLPADFTGLSLGEINLYSADTARLHRYCRYVVRFIALNFPGATAQINLHSHARPRHARGSFEYQRFQGLAQQSQSYRPRLSDRQHRLLAQISNRNLAAYYETCKKSTKQRIPGTDYCAATP